MNRVDELMYTVLHEKLGELTKIISHDLPAARRSASASDRAQVLHALLASAEMMVTAADTLYTAASEEAETLSPVRHISEAPSRRNKSPQR